MKLYDISWPNSSPEKLQLPFEWNKKMEELDPKYPVPETVKFAQQHLDVPGKFAMSSEPSSSFQVVDNILSQMAAKPGCSSKDDVPMLISNMPTYESSTNTQVGSKLCFMHGYPWMIC